MMALPPVTAEIARLLNQPFLAEKSDSHGLLKTSWGFPDYWNFFKENFIHQSYIRFQNSALLTLNYDFFSTFVPEITIKSKI